MQASSWLLAYAVGLGLGLDVLVAPAATLRAHPRLGLCVCLCAGLGVALATAFATVLLAHDVLEHGLSWILDTEKALIHAAYAEPREISRYWNVFALLPLAATLGASIQLYRWLRAAQTARAVSAVAAERTIYISTTAGPSTRLGVLRSPVPELYCIAGRKSTHRIHVTTGALEVLDERELSAAVEHERGHVQGRHHWLVLVADMLAVHRFLGLLRSLPATVRELVELDADDYAAQRHGSRPVAAALLRLATSRSACPPGGLRASSNNVGARISRLLYPERRPLAPPVAWLLVAASVAMPIVPIAVSGVPALEVILSADKAQQAKNDGSTSFVHHP